MIKQQENKFTMYNAVNAFLDENREIVETNLGLDNKRKLFVSKCSKINAAEETKRTAMSGRSASRKQAKNKAITKSFAITAALYSLGNENEDPTLQESYDMQRSRLEAMRDVELLEILESVHNRAVENLEVLTAQGLTAEVLGKYKTSIEAYSEALGKSQTGKIYRKDSVIDRKNLFKVSDSLLTQMDKFVESMKDDEPEFVRKYKDARKIRKFGIRYEKDETQQAPVVSSTGPMTSSQSGNNGPPVTGNG